MPHRADFQKLADLGAAVIAAQENRDGDPAKNCPKGWAFFRDPEAQSNAVYYNPKILSPVDDGLFRMSSPGFRSLRYIVWVRFKTKGGRPLHFGSVHLPAFKTSSKSAAEEFRKQEPKAAAWLAGDPAAVLAGDYNAQIPSNWTPNIQKVGVPSRQIPTGPAGQPIDYVVTHKGGLWKPTETRRIKSSSSDHDIALVKLVSTK